MSDDIHNTKHKNRWLRLSLRTLFVLLTVACVWLAFLVHQVNQQKRAIEWVTQVGGTVWYDYQLEGGGFIGDAEPPYPGWLLEWVDIDYLADVVLVNLNHTDVKEVTPLTQLTELSHLYLVGTQISNVTSLTRLKSLHYLTLHDTRVSDVTPLAHLKQLVSLDLGNTLVSDVSPLIELANLNELDLSFAPVTDVNPLVQLARLSEVNLSVDDSHVSEEDYTRLQSALPNCRVWAVVGGAALESP